MEPAPYLSEAERTRRVLIERYTMRLNHNYVHDSEKYPWLEDSSKNRYSPDVNVNNWVEERNDLSYIGQKTHALSDFDHAYETEYMSRFGKNAVTGKDVPNSRVAQSFPGHQPQLQRECESYETTARVAFQDPSLVSTRKTRLRCTSCRPGMA